MNLRERIAKAFVARVLKYIGPDNMAEVVRRNRTPEYAGGVCASHDFCDANVFMARAFRAVTRRKIRLNNDDDLQLWSDAWELAKHGGFAVSTCKFNIT